MKKDMLTTRYAHIKLPNTAPPLNVELMAPMIGDVGIVLKKPRKLGDRMTSVITPASYPKRNDPVAAKIARAMLKSSPMMRGVCQDVLVEVKKMIFKP